MATLMLSIKAQDIFETKYTNGQDCAITRALDRAGYSNLVHGGTDICDRDTLEPIVDNRNSKYRDLCQRVWDMYEAKEERRFEDINTFQFTITY